jgi:hypothetical protein
MQITEEHMNRLPFQFFQKTALLKARPLTDVDYQQRGGIIQTREGSAGFEPGDYLARGIENEEWPITKEHFATSYDRHSEPDAEGFASYRTTTICQAYQMLEPFTVRRMRGDVLTGKAGDYFVRSGERIWIVDRAIFENSYERVS